LSPDFLNLFWRLSAIHSVEDGVTLDDI